MFLECSLFALTVVGSFSVTAHVTKKSSPGETSLTQIKKAPAIEEWCLQWTARVHSLRIVIYMGDAPESKQAGPKSYAALYRKSYNSTTNELNLVMAGVMCSERQVQLKAFTFFEVGGYSQDYEQIIT
eukprot:IDg12768t1